MTPLDKLTAALKWKNPRHRKAFKQKLVRDALRQILIVDFGLELKEQEEPKEER